MATSRLLDALFLIGYNESWKLCVLYEDLTKMLIIVLLACHSSVLYTVPPECTRVVFGSYSLFSRLCSDERLESVAMEDSSEKILSSIFHNL